MCVKIPPLEIYLFKNELDYDTYIGLKRLWSNSLASPFGMLYVPWMTFMASFRIESRPFNRFSSRLEPAATFPPDIITLSEGGDPPNGGLSDEDVRRLDDDANIFSTEAGSPAWEICCGRIGESPFG